MDSTGGPTHNHHIVCIPFPLQGHINPMMKLAKIIHHRGFHITFVNTEFNHRRLLRARPSFSLPSLPRFHFQTIPDGLPISDKNSARDLPSLFNSTSTSCLPHFRQLLLRLNSSSHPVSAIISDTNMFFTLEVAQQLSIPNALLLTCNATAGVCCTHYATLVDRGITPFKDTTCFTNGYMDTVIDWITGIDSIRIRDIPTFIRTTDPDDTMLHFMINVATESHKAAAIIINTFHSLEQTVLEAYNTGLPPPVYTVGPLHMMAEAIVEDESVRSIGSNLWKEDDGCLQWLDTKKKGSVVYINYGSITVMTEEQLGEFAWGLADSMSPFLWVIRADLVGEEGVVVPPEFVEKTKERGMITSWCDQERVLKHDAVGGFLTHSGWNSTLESIEAGVPIICWPFFADQQTNCFLSEKWGIGAEIGGEVKRGEVERLVRELMEGEMGKRMKENIMGLKENAMAAISPGGSSFAQMDAFIKEILVGGEGI